MNTKKHKHHAAIIHRTAEKIKRREKKKRKRMPVSGKGVFQTKAIINRKSKSRKAKSSKRTSRQKRR